MGKTQNIKIMRVLFARKIMKRYYIPLLLLMFISCSSNNKKKTNASEIIEPSSDFFNNLVKNHQVQLSKLEVGMSKTVTRKYTISQDNSSAQCDIVREITTVVTAVNDDHFSTYNEEKNFDPENNPLECDTEMSTSTPRRYIRSGRKISNLKKDFHYSVFEMEKLNFAIINSSPNKLELFFNDSGGTFYYNLQVSYFFNPVHVDRAGENITDVTINPDVDISKLSLDMVVDITNL